jgi:hypothetical protein
MNADEALLLIVKSNMKTLDDIFVNIKPHNKPEVMKKKEYDDYKMAVNQFNSLVVMNKEILDHLYPNRKASGVTLLVDSITDFSDDAEWVECEITTYKTGANNE